MKNDDDQYAAHCEMFRRAGFSAESVARAREAAEREGPQLKKSGTANPDNASLDCDDMAAAYASKPLPKSPFFAAPPEDPTELLVGVVSYRKRANPDDASLDCDDMAAAHDALREPTTKELPALLEKHAARLAELGHYGIAADVQLASERIVATGSQLKALATGFCGNTHEPEHVGSPCPYCRYDEIAAAAKKLFEPNVPHCCDCGIGSDWEPLKALVSSEPEGR